MIVNEYNRKTGTTKEEDMTNIGDGFKNIFLAGIGAMAFTGEKGKEIIDQLVEKGEITLDQGRELNEELKRKAGDTTSNIRESALEASMKMMSPEDRERFAAKAAEFAKAQNEADAAKAAEKAAEEAEPVEAEVIAEEVVADVAEAAEAVAEEVAEAIADEAPEA